MEHLFRDDFSVYVSPEIVQEYFETYNEVHKKYSNRGNPILLTRIIEKTNVIVPQNKISLCLDPDDDKSIDRVEKALDDAGYVKPEPEEAEEEE
jgi:predicted nucleic acid-binding protein